MRKGERNIQIGILGSVFDCPYSKGISDLAEETGYLIAQSGAIVLYGTGGEFDALTSDINRGAKRGGGVTVGFSNRPSISREYGGEYFQDADVVIPCGRRLALPLVISCDALIGITWGNNTYDMLVEADKERVPLLAFTNIGLWDELLNQSRFEGRVQAIQTPQEAVDAAFASALRRRGY